VNIREVVDELIAGEEIDRQTLKELPDYLSVLLERNDALHKKVNELAVSEQEAWRRVTDLTATLANFESDLMKYLKVNGKMRDEALELAGRLARGGDLPHKEKNELIMRVIGELLHMNRYAFPIAETSANESGLF